MKMIIFSAKSNNCKGTYLTSMIATFVLPYRAIALLSKTAPSGVSRTGTCNEMLKLHSGPFCQPSGFLRYKTLIRTFPIGFILRNSGVLFDTPI
jgi:hypothetical protein